MSLPICCGHWSDNSSSNPWLKSRCLRKPPLTGFGAAAKARLLGHHKAFSGRNLQSRECKAPQQSIPLLLVQAKRGYSLLPLTASYHKQAPASLNCAGCSYHHPRNQYMVPNTGTVNHCLVSVSFLPLFSSQLHFLNDQNISICIFPVYSFYYALLVSFICN